MVQLDPLETAPVCASVFIGVCVCVRFLQLVYNVELKSVVSDSVCLNQWVESDFATNQLIVWLVDVQLAGCVSV